MGRHPRGGVAGKQHASARPSPLAARPGGSRSRPPSPSTTPRPRPPPRPCPAPAENGSTQPSFTKLGNAPRREECGSRTMSASGRPVSLGLIRSPTGEWRSIGIRVVFSAYMCVVSQLRNGSRESDRGSMSSALFGSVCPRWRGSIQSPSERLTEMSLASDGRVRSLVAEGLVGPPATNVPACLRPSGCCAGACHTPPPRAARDASRAPAPTACMQSFFTACALQGAREACISTPTKESR